MLQENQNLETIKNKYSIVFDGQIPTPPNVNVNFTDIYGDLLAQLRNRYPPKSKLKKTLREIVADEN